MKKIMLVILTGVLLALTGCIGIQSDPDSVLPQNAPADWEHTTFGVPM